MSSVRFHETSLLSLPSPNMAISFRPPKTTQKVVPVKPPKGHFFFAGRAYERVAWWSRPNLRRLYIYIVILILTNTANGFDGSMMNVRNIASVPSNVYTNTSRDRVSNP
jgi:hypothetical protein